MGKLLTERVGNILTTLMGNVLTTRMGKVLDIYIKILRAEKHLVEDVLKSLYNPIPPWLLDGKEDGLDAQMKAEAYHKPKGVRIPITPS